MAEWQAFYEAEAEYDAVVPSDECWVVHHVIECVTEGISLEEFLEELGDFGPIVGPIPVKVWNEGDFEESIPRMKVWEPTHGRTEMYYWNTLKPGWMIDFCGIQGLLLSEPLADTGSVVLEIEGHGHVRFGSTGRYFAIGAAPPIEKKEEDPTGGS